MITLARLRAAVFFFCTLVICLPCLTLADVINHPGQYTSIRLAVQWVGDRDTILVAPGTYYENINFLGKQFVLKSMAGPEQTILIPADQVAPMITCTNNDTGNCLIEGFTITGYDVGAVTDSVVIFDMSKLASPVIQNCIVRDNHGITVARVRDDGPSFRRCLFYNNTGGPVMQVMGGDVTFLFCTIDRCEFGIYAYHAGLEIRNCIISNLTGWALRGLPGQSDYNCLWNNGLPSDSGASPGLHDISADPMFVDPLNGDYNLLPGSPCINTGDPNPFFKDPDSSRGDIGKYYFAGPTDVGDDQVIPFGFELSQNYPNPFNPTTKISFSVPRRSNVRIDLYNVLGEHVRTLVDESIPAGARTVQWDGRSDTGTPVASGVYFYRLLSDDFTAIRQMVLLK